MNATQQQNLITLAEHLNRGTNRLWNFRRIARSEACGTSGCALGECPFLFGGDWVDEIARILANPDKLNFNRILKLCYQTFGLYEQQVRFLFLPVDEDEKDTDSWLGPDASPYDVARVIRFFLRTGRTVRRDEQELDDWPQFDNNIEDWILA